MLPEIAEIYEVICVLGKKIRTTKNYWRYISETKHADLAGKLDLVLLCLTKANEVWKKKDVHIYYHKINKHWVCVVTRHLNNDGFIVTVYLTSKSKRKGKKIWPKK
ncbi:DUF4258 domain-containing protein [Candidatus Parcubacteria bacterium]|nr:DUF4258 domain-containing protein [Patescibacteria group bacterium]MCG2693049.1 DUF4258 domain-containing protein [Candidatus Parcubacteria bacterium]